MIRLKAGFHPITVTFFERDGEEFLKASREGPGGRPQPIPPSVLFHTVETENEPEKPENAELKKEDPPNQAEH